MSEILTLVRLPNGDFGGNLAKIPPKQVMVDFDSSSHAENRSG